MRIGRICRARDVLVKSAAETIQKIEKPETKDVKYSVKQDKYGNRYWQIDTDKDLFEDITNTKTLQKKAFDFILNGEKGEIVNEIIDGKPLEFVRIGAKEYLYGTQSKILSKSDTTNEGLYNKKMRLAPSILDLIKYSNTAYQSNTKHRNSRIFTEGFQNYRGKVRIDNIIFDYIVRVGKTKASNLFYDINLKVNQKVPDASKDASLNYGLTSVDKSISQSNFDVNDSIRRSTNSDTSDIKFSKKKSFAEQVDEVLDDEIEFNSTHLYLGETPETLIKLGVPRLPVLATAKHIYTIAKESGKYQNANYHGLGADLVKQLPNAISNPIMTMRSNSRNDSIVELTTLVDDKNQPIIAAVLINGRGRLDNVDVAANIVTSAYGKAGINRFIQRAFEEGRILQFDKKRSQQLLEILGNQIPDSFSNSDFGRNHEHHNDPGVQFPNEAASSDLYGNRENRKTPGIQFPDNLANSDFTDSIRKFQENIKRTTEKNDTDPKTSRKYESMLYQYGAIKKGQQPAREVSVPQKTADNQVVSLAARTIMEAPATPNYMVSEFEKEIEKGTFSHEVVSDKMALMGAEHKIKRDGYEDALRNWDGIVEGSAAPDKVDIAMGQMLFNQAAITRMLKQP